MNEDYSDLLAALRWGATLEFIDEQRDSLSEACCRLAGCVPRAVLVAERKKRQAAEKRANELERALRSQRQEWVFRRKQRDAN